MSTIRVTTNFKDSDGVDLGDKLITKDYLISVYPEIGDKIGIPPELWIWGAGSNGRLGNNSTTNRSTPITTFAGGTDWKQVSCGGDHTAAVKTDGTLWVWGYDFYKQLGTGGFFGVDISVPATTFAGGTNWKQVSCGSRHTSAIKTDGTLWTWGTGSNGQLGTNDATTRSTPSTTFAGGTDWKQVSSGGYHTAAIKTDGTLWTWGSRSDGQLGNNTTSIFSGISTPITTFAGGTDWKQVSCGGDHTAAVKTDGTLWVWGEGLYGQLGTNSTSDKRTPVTTFAGGTNWKQVSCGYLHTSAIKTDGTLWTWGYGNSGRLGNNFTTIRSTPVTTFAGGTNWKQVSCGRDHTSSVKTDGTLWTWGEGAFGQLGNDSTTDRLTPVTTFAGGTDWKQVSSGGYHTAAIKSVDF
jgi:alpha-tubulin suppressor-like RCC1 family protein